MDPILRSPNRAAVVREDARLAKSDTAAGADKTGRYRLPGDLKRAGLAEISRVTKPGGRILIVDIQSSPGGSLGQRLSDLMIQLHGGHTAMQDNVKKLMPIVEGAGFTNLETDKVNRQLSFITAKKEL